MEFAIFEFGDLGELDVGETSWIEDIESLQTEKENFNFDRNVIVHWPAKCNGKTTTQPFCTRVVMFGNDRTELRHALPQLQANKVANKSRHDRLDGLKTPSRQLHAKRSLNHVSEDEEETNEPHRKQQKVSKAVRQTESAYILDAFQQAKSKHVQGDMLANHEEDVQCHNCHNCHQQADSIRELKQEVERLRKDNAVLRSSLLAHNGLPGIVTELKSYIAHLKEMQHQPQSHVTQVSKVAAMPNESSPPERFSFTDIPGTSSGTSPEETLVPRVSQSLVASCSRATSQKFVNDLMSILYTPEHMTTHSLSGVKSSKSQDYVKPALDKVDVRFIIDETMKYFPGLEQTDIKPKIALKLNNSSKIAKKKSTLK